MHVKMELVYKEGSDGVVTWEKMNEIGILFDGTEIMATSSRVPEYISLSP